MPHWAYGFWQSRQRYTTQDGVVRRGGRVSQAAACRSTTSSGLVLLERGPVGLARVRHGSAFPIRKAMIDKVHAQNAHFMISVWPKFYPATANYKELDAEGLHVPRNVEDGARDWVGQGYTNFVLRSVLEGGARRSTGARSTTGWSAWASTPGGWTPPSRTRTRISIDRRGAHRWARPRRARRGDLQHLSTGPRGGVVRRFCARRSPTSARSSSRARASPASSAMRRRCGAATSPRAGTICTTRSRRA